MEKRFVDLLSSIYGPEIGRELAGRLETLVQTRMQSITAPDASGNDEPARNGSRELPLDERDALMITYGDQWSCRDSRKLECLKAFADEFLDGIASGVHILPFFPYSSDDGFSIIDYRKVDPQMGTWEDISAIGESYKLMSDLVLNHCSVKSDWFQAFLRDDPKYRNYFITVDPEEDLSMIVRPRDLPLLTKVETAHGPEHVWTTFSDDQVDLNFANPDVLLEMIDVLLYHVARGVQIIRLDAIAYVWKEIGRPSIHHPKTHAIVKLFRAVIDAYVPWVLMITETNVPHEENISYFGDGSDEAQMVYQFSLPPLVLDAFLRGDASHLRSWAGGLDQREAPVTYFNFLASHDGIGLTPAHGILSESEIDSLVAEVERRGGLVSYKATAEGRIPYELNINYRDAVSDPDASDAQRARAFLASQSIMLAMAGVPGIYVHSIIGSGNYREGVERTGMNRTINREKLELEQTVEELRRDGSMRKMVYDGFRDMLTARRSRKSFHPKAGQRILPTSGSVFGILRSEASGPGMVACLVNTSGREVAAELAGSDLGVESGARLQNILAGGDPAMSWDGGRLSVTLAPYQVVWLE